MYIPSIIPIQTIRLKIIANGPGASDGVFSDFWDKIRRIYLDPISLTLPNNPMMGTACGHLLDQKYLTLVENTCPCCRKTQDWVRVPHFVTQTLEVLREMPWVDTKIEPRQAISEDESKIYSDEISQVKAGVLENDAGQLSIYLQCCETLSQKLPDVTYPMFMALGAAVQYESPVDILRYATLLTRFKLEDPELASVLFNKALAEKFLGFEQQFAKSRSLILESSIAQYLSEEQIASLQTLD